MGRSEGSQFITLMLERRRGANQTTRHGLVLRGGTTKFELRQGEGRGQKACVSLQDSGIISRSVGGGGQVFGSGFSSRTRRKGVGGGGRLRGESNPEGGLGGRVRTLCEGGWFGFLGGESIIRHRPSYRRKRGKIGRYERGSTRGVQP